MMLVTVAVSFEHSGTPSGRVPIRTQRVRSGGSGSGSVRDTLAGGAT